ncbi:hypothetical protein LLG39_05945, partial [bacterium]|nr:hypothetical protein [bacterium]
MLNVREKVSATTQMARERAGKARETIAAQRPRIDAAMSVPEKTASSIYIGMTVGSIILSLLLFWRKQKDNALFVGMWAPTFLTLGLFSKLVAAEERKQRNILSEN